MNGNIQSKKNSIFSWIICDLFILFKISFLVLLTWRSGSRVSCQTYLSFPVHQLLYPQSSCENLWAFQSWLQFLTCQFGQTDWKAWYAWQPDKFLPPSLSCSHTIFCQIWIPNLRILLSSCQIHSFIEWYIYLRCRIFFRALLPFYS